MNLTLQDSTTKFVNRHSEHLFWYGDEENDLIRELLLIYEERLALNATLKRNSRRPRDYIGKISRRIDFEDSICEETFTTFDVIEVFIPSVKPFASPFKPIEVFQVQTIWSVYDAVPLEIKRITKEKYEEFLLHSGKASSISVLYKRPVFGLHVHMWDFEYSVSDKSLPFTYAGSEALNLINDFKLIRKSGHYKVDLEKDYSVNENLNSEELPWKRDSGLKRTLMQNLSNAKKETKKQGKKTSEAEVPLLEQGGLFNEPEDEEDYNLDSDEGCEDLVEELVEDDLRKSISMLNGGNYLFGNQDMTPNDLFFYEPEGSNLADCSVIQLYHNTTKKN